MSRTINKTSFSHKLDVKPEAHSFENSGPLNRVVIEKADAQLRVGRDIEKKKRTVLSEQDARHIFQNKPPQGARDRKHADVLASFYGVSVKTIHDIWNGRTWYRSTCHLDPSKPVNLHRLQRKPGRPLGAKDSKPRFITPISDEVISNLPPPEPVSPQLPGSLTSCVKLRRRWLAGLMRIAGRSRRAGMTLSTTTGPFGTAQMSELAAVDVCVADPEAH